MKEQIYAHGMSHKKVDVKQLTQLGILIALIVVMAFTPLGYLRLPGLSITFLTVPVIIGAILLGPMAGGILGIAFGITSLMQCFGLEPFGSALLSINPFFATIVCIVPRFLMGFLTGAIYKVLSKVSKNQLVNCAVTSLCGALLNTVLFMGTLVALYYNTDFIQGFVIDYGAGNPFMFIVLFVGINGLIEAGVSLVIATALTKPLLMLRGKRAK